MKIFFETALRIRLFRRKTGPNQFFCLGVCTAALRDQYLIFRLTRPNRYPYCHLLSGLRHSSRADPIFARRKNNKPEKQTHHFLKSADSSGQFEKKTAMFICHHVPPRAAAKSSQISDDFGGSAPIFSRMSFLKMIPPSPIRSVFFVCAQSHLSERPPGHPSNHF